ncbi:MAG: CHAT domain-containing protein, partial [Gemmataceae bacterium]|nr:CHAT domain-containing protein [Gemmataceae bacterium]
SVVASLRSVDDAATAVLMERFCFHLWEKKRSKAEALRQAQLDVLRNPGWVEDRADKLRGVAGVRGAGMSAEKLPGGARRSPTAWWAAFALSGDWR